MKSAKILAVRALLLGMIALGGIRTAAAGTRHDAIFVANSYDVTAYPVGSKGDVAPIALTTDMANPSGIARDLSGRIYVANRGTNTVTIYAAKASGNVPPLAVIGGSRTRLSNPAGIELDASGKIYVLNGSGYSNGSITVYPPLGESTGVFNEAPITTIAGSQTQLVESVAIAVDSRGDIYVANMRGGPTGPGNIYAPGTITLYRAGSNGNVAPAATISGAATGLVYPLCIALDSDGNIYVGNSGLELYTGKGTFTFDPTITVYSAGGAGNLVPIRTIVGNNTGLDYPQGIALDSNGNLFAEDFVNGLGNAVNAYAAGSDGNVSPLASIVGGDTGLNDPYGIALDSERNIYVSNSSGGPTGGGSITIYAPGSSGDAVPSATITSSFTGLPWANNIAVGATGIIYVANEWGSIDIYPAGSFATGSPVATIVGDDTGLFYPLGIGLDSRGNIFVLNDDNAVTVYSAGSAGDATPKATINIDSNAKNVPTGIAVSPHGDLYVTNRGTVKCNGNGPPCHRVSLPNVAVYPAGHTNAKPSAVISGPNTELASPSAVAVDDSGDIYVTDEGPAKCTDGCCIDSGPGSVTVYAPGSNGDVKPILRIKGKRTGLWFPYGITLDSKGNIYVLNDGAPLQYGGCHLIEIYNGGAPISIFAAGSNGDVAPIAGIGGPSTQLYGAGGIAVGPTGQ